MKASTWRWMTGFALAAFGFAAQAADPIKIGSVLSATGPAAFLGDPEVKTLEMYVESINKAGGLLGRPLQLVHYDDGSDANKANSFAKRLIYDDQVVGAGQLLHGEGFEVLQRALFPRDRNAGLFPPQGGAGDHGIVAARVVPGHSAQADTSHRCSILLSGVLQGVGKGSVEPVDEAFGAAFSAQESVGLQAAFLEEGYIAGESRPQIG